MKLPLIFKTPRNKRFNFEPRYYDPIKEEIKERTEMFRRQLNANDSEFIRSNISNAFAKRSREYHKGNAMQFVFIIAFIAVTVGYLFYGNIALISFLVVLPVYIFIKIRRNI
jgi:hypothetical protein